MNPRRSEPSQPDSRGAAPARRALPRTALARDSERPTRLLWLPPRGDTIDVGLHVRSAGAGPPTLVLLHGLAGSHRYFGAAYDELGRQARLIVPDLLGFGRSPRPRSADYGLEGHAVAVVDALERLGIEGPIYMAGHSVGALVALRVALLRPEWIRAIVAFGPPLFRDRAHARRHLARLALWLRMFAMDGPLASCVCGMLCQHRRAAARVFAWFRPELPPEIVADAALHSWSSYSGTFTRAIASGLAAADLAAVRVPVRIVAGEGDTVVDAQFLRELAAAHGHVQLEFWPGDHDLPLVHPERCRELLLRSSGALRGRRPRRLFPRAAPRAPAELYQL